MINIEINTIELLRYINKAPTIVGLPTLATLSYYLTAFVIVSALAYRVYKAIK